jgi:hypothetical protein
MLYGLSLSCLRIKNFGEIKKKLQLEGRIGIRIWSQIRIPILPSLWIRTEQWRYLQYLQFQRFLQLTNVARLVNNSYVNNGNTYCWLGRKTSATG